MKSTQITTALLGVCLLAIAADGRAANATLSPGSSATATTAPAPLFTCRMVLTAVGSVIGAGYVEDIARSGHISSDMVCPDGVTAINVTQVTWDPFGGISSRSIAQGVLSVALGSKAWNFVVPPFLVLGTASALTGVPAYPVRLDINTAETIIYRHACGSGDSAVRPTCGGVLYFTGTK